MQYITVRTNEIDTSRTDDLEVFIDVSEGSTDFIVGVHQQAVTIPSGATSAKYKVLTIGDATAGGINGTITANVQPGAYYKLASRNTRATVMVLDDGTFVPPTVEFALMTLDVVEGTITNVAPNIMVNLSYQTGHPVMVQFTLNEGTATEPEDYGLATGATQTLSFAPGEIQKAIPIEIVPDEVIEERESFTVTLTNATNASLGTILSNTVTIQDDDGVVSVALDAPVSVVEGDDISVILTATSTKTSEQTIMVDLQVANVTGTYLDYTNTLVEIVAAAKGVTTKSVSVSTQNVPSSTEGEISLVVVQADGYEITSTDLTRVKVIAKEALPVISIETTSLSTIQEGENAVFTIRATGTLATDLPVIVSYDQGSSDFIKGTPTTTPEIDSITNSVVYTIETLADTDHEANGTITVTIVEDPKKANLTAETRTMDATYLVGSPASMAVMVEDNDAAAGSPIITISADSDEVYEGNDAVFTISNSGSSEVNVHYSIIKAGDFLTNTATEGDLNVPATSSEKLNLATTPDADTETDGTVTVQLIADTEDTATYSVGTSFKDTITIQDDDDATFPSVSIAYATSIAANPNITEGENDAVFTITSTDGSTGTGGTLEVDINITQTGNFLQTPPRKRSETITIGTDFPLTEMIHDDETDEANGSITATLVLKDTLTYGIGANNQATINVSDDEGLPALTFDELSYTVVEGNLPTGGATPTPTVLTLNVGLSQLSAKEIVVNYTIGDEANDSAKKDDDYEVPSDDTGSITFPANSTAKQPISIDVVKDDLFEINEEITVTFTIPSASTSLVEFPTDPSTNAVINKITATITNDDDKPSISIADEPNIMEGAQGESGPFEFTVTLSEPAGVPIEISYVTINGTATGDVDFTEVTEASNSSVMIPASDNSGTNNNTTIPIPITITGDDVGEQDETFEVEISAASDITTGISDKATGTIINDDTPVFTISGMSIAEGDNTIDDVKLIFDVTISSGATENEKVNFATSDGPAHESGGIAMAGSDYEATTKTLEFELNGPKTIQVGVPIVEDRVFEFDESFTATLTANDENPTTATEILINSAVGTITNDEALRIFTIGVTAKTVTVTEGDMVEFEFSASPQLDTPLPIMVSVTQVRDFLMVDPATITMVNIPVNTSLTSKHLERYATKPINDNFELNGSVTLTISPATNNTYAIHNTDSTAAVRIEDADTPTGVSILAISENITEGETAQFEIRAHSTASAARSVNVSIDDGSANFLTQAEKDRPMVEIPANKRALIIDVPTIGDSDPERHGVVTVAIEDAMSGATFEYTKSSYHTATVTVFDDDSPESASNPGLGISIFAVDTPVTEAANTYAEFQVIAERVDDTNVRTINVQVANDTGDDFIDPNQDATYNYNASTNNFEVAIPAGDHYGLLRVKIHEDSKNEDNGMIMATVMTGTGYVPADSRTTASIEIHDNDDEVPIISISSDATTVGVTEGYSFAFEVQSDQNFAGSPATPLLISFNVMDAGTGASIEGTTVTIQANSRTAIGTVSGIEDVASDTEIMIEIVEGALYDVASGSAGLITVNVKDNDNTTTVRPSLAISSANYIADGSQITFTVEASDVPDSAIDVDIVLTGRDNIVGGTLTAAARLDRADSDTFTVNTVAGTSGIITATIVEGADFVLSNSATESVASVAVVDNLPVISISNINDLNKSAGDMTEDVGTFTFALNSDTPAVAGHPIEITGLTIANASADIPQYYTSHGPTDIEISGSNTTITVDITADNTTYQGWGQINVNLASGDDYTANTNANSRSVTIIDDQTAPILVAIDAPVSIVEEDSISITLTATSTSSSEQTIMVDLRAADVTGTYLDYTNTLVEIVAAANTATPKTVEIQTQDVTSSMEGAISLVIKRGDGYETASTDPTNVKVIAKEDLPEVSIVRTSPAMIQEGEPAVFTISATGTLAADLPVTVSYSQSSSNFIMGAPTLTPEIDSDTNSVTYTIDTVADTVSRIYWNHNCFDFRRSKASQSNGGNANYGCNLFGWFTGDSRNYGGR